MTQAEQIVAGLGGRANIVEVEACITRLRTELADSSLVNEQALKDAGVHGVMRAGAVVEVEACITRLRTELADSSLVNEQALKDAGVHGVMRAGAVVQVVVGPEADVLASYIEDLL